MADSFNCIAYERGVPKTIDALERISDELQSPDTFIWFDIVNPVRDDLSLLQEEFGLHPLAVEDAVAAHQRSKIESYDTYWFLVVHGAHRDGEALIIHEIAVFVGKQFLITVRAVPPYPLDEIKRRWEHHAVNGNTSGAMLYTILDTLVDAYWPIAERYEERVAELEARLFEEGKRTRDALIEIFQIKKELQRFRKAFVPMREILITIQRNDLDILEPKMLPYFRDVYDHTTRLIDEMDSARDIVNAALEIQLGLTANQQNEVAKQLTVIATIFLPLTYLTGFFGQNFGFLVNGITSQQSFWYVGVGSELVALVVLLWYFKAKRWL